MNKLSFSLLITILFLTFTQVEGFLSKRAQLENQVTDIQSSADFFIALNNNDYVLAMLVAKWKGFDKAKATFSELSDQYTNVKFLNVNLDVNDNETIEQQYPITILPTYILFKNSTVVSQEGAATKAQLIDILENLQRQQN